MLTMILTMILSTSVTMAVAQEESQEQDVQVSAPVQKHQDLTLFIPSGQLSNQMFKVFIPNIELSREMDPKLFLKMNSIEQSFSPVIVSPDHIMVKKVEEEEIREVGTLMMFNINKLKSSKYYASIRVVPQVKWIEGTGSHAREISLVYDDYYFIGNNFGTFIWTTVIVASILLLITLLLYARKKKEQWLGLISDTNGQVSMALLQMFLWTIAVSYMVLAFGILRLNVPNIPNTLITLMLFAAATSTAGHIQTKVQLRKEGKLKSELKLDNVKPEANVTQKKEGFWAKFSTVFYADKYSEYPSMAKVQVLIWTIITLVLFVYLSFKEGELWDVPNELVILMGISQATFLGRQQMAIQDVNAKLKDVQPPAAQPPETPATPPSA